MNIPQNYAGTIFKRYKYGNIKRGIKLCRVPGCKKLEQPDLKTSLHLFPKDKKLRKEWAIKCRIAVDIKEYFTICNHHFKETEFYTGVGKDNRKPILKKGVVPSRNLPMASFSEYPRKPESKFTATEIINQIQARQIRLKDRQNRIDMKPVPEVSNTSPVIDTTECPNSADLLDVIEPIEPISMTGISNHAESSNIADKPKPINMIEPVNQSISNHAERSNMGDKPEPSSMTAHPHSNTVAFPIQEEKTFKDSSIQVNTIEDFIPKFSVFEFITNDTKLNSWTGLPSFDLLDAIEDCLYTAFPNILTTSNLNKCSVRERIVLVFMKLKTNMTFVCLADLFSVSNDTISRTFGQMVVLLAKALQPLIYFPTVEENQANMPIAFKKYNYTDVRSILDASEIKIQAMKCTNCRICTYSTYKKDYTTKFMINITPGGFISHVSVGYSGKASDKFIFNQEKLIEKFDGPNDSIMVDKGVMIEDDLVEHELTLVRPSFFRAEMGQFEEEEAVKNTRIAALRVHVERALQRMKIFAVMTDRIEYNLHPYVNEILIIVAAIANLTKPILAADKF